MGKNKIKFCVMDVDGTLTDGKIYMGASGELLKAFNIKDGYAIKEILPLYGILPVIITARSSNILENRCVELGVEELYQGCCDKLGVLSRILEKHSREGEIYDFSNVLYTGDDIIDIPCMKKIRETGGIVACPLDAVAEVKSISHYISMSYAGEGAMRDIIEHVTAMSTIDNIDPQIRAKEVVEYLKSLDLNQLEIGTYNVTDDFYYIVKEVYTQDERQCLIETHKKHIDIHWVIDGVEVTKITSSKDLMYKGAYDDLHDVVYWSNKSNMTEICMSAGSYIVIYPGEAHAPLIASGKPSVVKLLVAKIKVS